MALNREQQSWAKKCIENSKALLAVPKELLTEEFCLEVVKMGGEALEYVPENYKTTELCLEAVKQNDEALQHVPASLLDDVFRARLKSIAATLAPPPAEKPAGEESATKAKFCSECGAKLCSECGSKRKRQLYHRQERQ